MKGWISCRYLNWFMPICFIWLIFAQVFNLSCRTILCMVERAVEGFNGTLYELRYHVRQTMQAVQIIHALNAVKWYIGTGMEI